MIFHGFPRAGLAFLADLAEQNDRAWFAANKQIYQSQLLAPAQAFVLALGARLSALAPGVQADPRTDGRGTLMRITRDTRFSPDKTPYKTNVSGIFWDGSREKLAAPAFGFRLQAGGMDLMAGMFQFPPPALPAFRDAVADARSGALLAQTVVDIAARPGYAIEGERYQRVPAGYAADHPRADLLRLKGLAALAPPISADLVCSEQLVDVCAEHFANLAPLQRWLADTFA
jgi:uncharacterized protein (TIGR02453 family)